MTSDEVVRLAINAALGLIGFSLTTAIAVIGYFLRHLHQRVDTHIVTSEQESKALVELRARFQAFTEGTKEKLDDFCDQLTKMDEKLDRLIERGA